MAFVGLPIAYYHLLFFDVLYLPHIYVLISGYNRVGPLYLQMETNINSVIGDPSLKRLVVTEERPSVWNATYSSFFPNEVSLFSVR